MLKRIFDAVIAAAGLLLSSPVLIPFMIAIWLQDGHNPLYVAARVGKDGALFPMIKLRSMTAHADRTGVASTASNDLRITPIGRFLRAFKLDEIPQLWNVLLGHMSLVGPRPNVSREVNSYTAEERRLLNVRPGITDIASVVFADEGEILKGSPDPDLSYNLRIRPWKSRLGLVYVDHRSFFLDLHLIGLTLLALVSRKIALEKIQNLLAGLSVEEPLRRVAQRQAPLPAAPPPGTGKAADKILSHAD